MRHIIYYTFFLVLLYIPESLAGIINPVGFPSGIPGLITAQASRTEGAAPLSVFFNAQLKPSSPTERSFHDYEYSWDFGDPNSGNWGTTGKSKNSDKGPVAAHVYETPGSYTATLTVRDASGIINSDTFYITITDPDIVFSGTNTTCVSDTSHNDFTGCPDGATQLTTDDLSSMPSWTQSGERLLFHRGSSWTTPGDAYPDYPAKAETVRIGAYGTCSNPNSSGICENAPSITVSTGATAFINLYNNPDWVVSDITASAPKDVHGIISGSMGLSKLLLLRVKTTGFNSPLGWGHWRTETLSHPSEMAIVSCDARDFLQYGVYAGGEKFSLMGGNFHNSDTTHVARIWWANQGVISHNEFTGSSLTNTNGRQALKFHGPKFGTEVGTYTETGAAGLPSPTQYAVVANNVFGSSGPWPVSIGPQDDWADERLSDIVFEKNKIIADYGQQSPKLWSVALHTRGYYHTIRNNIIDGSYDTEDPGDLIGIEVGTTSILPTPTGTTIYNNTIYCDGDELQNGMWGIKVLSGVTGTIIKNNYVSFPDETHMKISVIDESGFAVISNNVITETPGFADSRTLPPINRDFSLTFAATEAIIQGDIVPVLDDFSGTTRSGIFDIGADSY